MKVSRIDHVHIEVADRNLAAQWYERVLGLTRSATLESWADDPMGPLILEGGDGHPALSLFARDAKDVLRDTTVAFRVSGEEFLGLCNDIERLDLKDKSGKIVTKADAVDHGLSWSIYFLDPDGNRLEVTTYDYGIVSDGI
jgi:catechol 2,3-dioxygenase-like lactoylglutathione lyase family enzyme